MADDQARNPLEYLRPIIAAQLRAGAGWLRERDLTHQQAFILDYLLGRPGVIQRELAVASRTTAANVSGVVRGLEARGFVTRSSEDERSKQIHLTNEGTAIILGHPAAMADADERILALLTEDERAQLAGLLRKIADNLPGSHEGTRPPARPSLNGGRESDAPGVGTPQRPRRAPLRKEPTVTAENPMLTMIREVCSLGRAEFARPQTRAGDDGAQRALVAGLQALGPDGAASDISLSLSLLAPRAPYFDEQVLKALAADIPQIVNLGAGYDDRALRFRDPGTVYFELDLPGIVADKLARLTALGADVADMHLAGIDFAQDEVEKVLSAMGHDPARPTLFLAEHLALFLRPEDVERLVRGIARRAATGSKVALTAETHPEGLESADVIRIVDAVMFEGVGPLRTILTDTSWRRLLAEAGWSLEDFGRVSVDHFSIPLNSQDVPITTQFITAGIHSAAGAAN